MNNETKKGTSATPFQVAKAVFWAFSGIRSKSGHDADIERLKPVQVIVGGLIGGLLFVLSVLLLVRIVTN